MRIQARRLGRQRGTEGFGNARAVRNWFERACGRQAARVVTARKRGEAPDKWRLQREDLLGPRSVGVWVHRCSEMWVRGLGSPPWVRGPMGPRAHGPALIES